MGAEPSKKTFDRSEQEEKLKLSKYAMDEGIRTLVIPQPLKKLTSSDVIESGKATSVKAAQL